MATSAQTTAASSIEQPRRRPYPPELNVLLGLIVIGVIFETLGWFVRGESFLMNPQRISIIILQVSVVGIIAVG
jgi:inositol transport system permease protein